MKALHRLVNKLDFLLKHEGRGDLGHVGPPTVIKKFWLQLLTVERFSEIAFLTFMRLILVEYEAVIGASFGYNTNAYDAMQCEKNLKNHSFQTDKNGFLL